jgi:Domain of unknown function (DUF397)
MEINWRKSRYSAENGACVETASTEAGILVRDTTDRSGPSLRLSPAAWREFTSSLQSPPG